MTLLLLLALQDPALDKVARQVADHIVADPKGFEPLFSEAFFVEVPAEKMRAFFQEIHAANGPVTKVERKGAGTFTLTYEKGGRATLELAIDSDNKIIGLYIRPDAAARSLDDVVAELGKLPGTVSFRLAKLGDKVEVVKELNPESSLAIGSTFKLYILGTLVEDRRKWDEVIALRADRMSFPSGMMHTWPVGSPVTVHTLAAKMISISDNTATDHLLHHAGRERVEAMMKEMGNAKPERTRPFLATCEMFKLKSDAELAKKYLAADEPGRRALLDGAVREMSREKVRGYAKPKMIGTLEWFASAADLVRMMDWLRRKGDETAFQILAINPGVAIPRDRIAYAGYKGGSEPGVLNLTFLLRTKAGDWYALSAGWNNPDKSLDDKKLIALVQAAVDQLGK